MSSSAAALIFAVLIAGLFYLDREPAREGEARPSPALWLPTIWLFIGSSRNLSHWLRGPSTSVFDNEAILMDGSPIDRLFMSGLIAVALVVLFMRWERSGQLLRANGPLVVFFVYCAVSVLWSEYSFVALKRWTKALGNITMVLVVITDPAPAAALKRLFARTAFLLVPISMLFVKYYPHLGRLYNRWTWQTQNIGVSTDKNGLGTVCLVFGLASLWRFLVAFRDHGNPNRRRQLAAHGIVLAMVAWLLDMADSSTSLACFLLGGAILAYTARPAGQRTASPNVVAAAVITAPVLLALLLPEVFGVMIGGLGRNTTLTGRTDIWSDIFNMDVNPWLGTGFESFWLGPRAEFFWNKYYFRPNQAHNGYIETYINLGLIGLASLIAVIVSGYRNLAAFYRRDAAAGSLRLTFFLVALVYSVTEAAFKVTHPLWISFLLAVAATPSIAVQCESARRSIAKIPFVGPFGRAQAGPRLPIDVSA